MSDFAAIDGGHLTFLILFVLMVFSFIWGRYLSKLGSRYQTLMDVFAIILSGLVILSFAVGWTSGLFGYAV